MRAPSFKSVWKLLLLIASSGSVLACRGYTCLQVGVDSNFLVDDQRVLFAQADGSLTALALESGKVLVRDRTRDYSGTLLRAGPGMLLLGDRSIALLNRTNFSRLWETAFHCEPNLVSNALISCDESGLIRCGALDTGRLRWSYDLPGELEIVAESGKVLVHRAATYEKGLLPATVLLDQQTGLELFRKAPTNGVHWASAFFDGTNIFVEAGPFRGKRSDYEPERLVIWNANGEETSSLPIPAELRQTVRDGKMFELDRKTFWKGRVYASRESIPFERRGKRYATAERINDISQTFESDYNLGDDISIIERARYLGGTNREPTAFVMEIECRTSTNRWEGVLPYLLNRGRITAIGKADGRILIGTDFGHVECINAATGESQWLYVFPTLHRTMSYSSRGLPPTLTEAAAIFRSENRALPNSGLHIINGKAATPRVILDPSPVDPYAKLPLQLALAWAGAAISFVILVLIHTLPWTRKWDSNILGTIAVWFTFLLFGFYLFCGRVSPESSIALRLAILTGFVLGMLDAVMSFMRGQRIEAALMTVTLAAVGLFILLALV